MANSRSLQPGFHSGNDSSLEALNGSSWSSWRGLLGCLLVTGSMTGTQAAPITSLTVTSGEFRMGNFTPQGPIQFIHTADYNLVDDFPTVIGWDLNTGQNSKNTVCSKESVVCFEFGDPLVNTFIVDCDPQTVDTEDALISLTNGIDSVTDKPVALDVQVAAAQALSDGRACPHRPPSGTVNGGSATIADGDTIVVNIPGFYANWNGIDFNQGGTTGDGTAYAGKFFNGVPLDFAYTSRVRNVVANTFEYEMTWTSLIVGGSFNGNVGAWTLRGAGTVALQGDPPRSDVGTLLPDHFATESGLTTADLASGLLPLPGFGRDCIGGCWDWVVTDLPKAGDPVNVTLPLNGAIPSLIELEVGVMKLDTASASWIPFDTSTGDQVRSAPRSGGSCPAPGDAAYVSGLVSGNECLQLTITDGGPNDDDGVADGVIKDPGGIVGTSVTPTLTAIPDNGCALTSSPPRDFSKHTEWLLITGFCGWLGITTRYRRRRPL